MDFEKVIAGYSSNTISILDPEIALSDYCQIDFSANNKELEKFDVASPDSCQEYIDGVLAKNGTRVAYGGYLELRTLYSSERFSVNGLRNIHLGMDFWCEAGTKVMVPMDGTVYSFANNSDLGNYGPTIILHHKLNDCSFYTLYGHLSLESIKDLEVGKQFYKGDVLGTLGTPDINVNYAPHLHFQLIKDIEGKKGDYPGVCSKKDLHFYQKNCPNPDLLLKFDF